MKRLKTLLSVAVLAWLFSLVIVTCVVLLAFFSGAGLLNEYRDSGQAGPLIGGIAFILGGLDIIWNGWAVLRKLKHIGYL